MGRSEMQGMVRSVWVLLAACSSTPRTLADPGPRVDGGPVEVASEGLERDLQRVAAFHATRPTLETPLGVGREIPEGVGSLSAEQCAACHPQIAEEWRVSTHAAAWTDRQYQAEILKSGNRWLCLNCHTPLLVQQDVWPIGLVDGDVERPLLVPNAVFDADLRNEGITCAACHVREGVIHGPGLGGSPPHPVAADPDFRSDALCLRCHQAVATYPGKDFVCTFETGAEWAAGPYKDEGVGCVDCHMPAIQRPAAVGGPVREVRRHWWRGAGIPKVAGVHPPLEANPPGLSLAAEWTDSALTLKAANARAGHKLPSGDPERWVQIDVVFVDADGGSVGTPWTARIGQEWVWYPVPEKRSDNRLAPREERSYSIATPAGATEARVEAWSHRMSEEAAAYHHLEDYPRSIRTHQLTLKPGTRQAD